MKASASAIRVGTHRAASIRRKVGVDDCTYSAFLGVGIAFLAFRRRMSECCCRCCWCYRCNPGFHPCVPKSHIYPSLRKPRLHPRVFELRFLSIENFKTCLDETIIRFLPPDEFHVISAAFAVQRRPGSALKGGCRFEDRGIAEEDPQSVE